MPGGAEASSMPLACDASAFAEVNYLCHYRRGRSLRQPLPVAFPQRWKRPFDGIFARRGSTMGVGRNETGFHPVGFNRTLDFAGRPVVPANPQAFSHF